MRERLQARLDELKKEFQTGQVRLLEVETQQSASTISGVARWRSKCLEPT